MLGLFGCYVAAEEDFGGEVIGVSSEIASARVCTLGVALAVAFGVFEKIEIEHFGFVEVPAVVGHVYEVSGYDDLVEEVPLALVCESSDALVELAPPGIEESVSLDAFRLLFGTQNNGAALVLRVVVEVTHYYYADLGVYVPERVGYLLAESGSGLTVGRRLLLAAETRRPVVDNDGYTLAQKRSDDAHLVAGAVWNSSEAVVGHVLDAEVALVVDHAYVYATCVGRIVVNDGEVEVLKLRLGDDIFHHRAVLDLRHADDSGAERSDAGLELRDGVGEVMHLLIVFAAVPLARTAGGELYVATLGIIGNSVEEILEIIESDSGNLHFAVVGSTHRQNC